MNEIDTLLNYAVKQGLIDDSAVDWSDEEKRHYATMCDSATNHDDQ